MCGTPAFRCALTRGAVIVVVTVFLPLPPSARAQSNADRVGCTHVAGRYNFTSTDFLNEGAIEIARTGMRTIKVYLSPGGYPFNSTWPPAFPTLVLMASHPYYQSLFSKPFNTYVMTTYSTVSPDGNYWRNAITSDQSAQERQEFHDLAKYLLTTYRGTGKTFIFQHWEGDWSLRGTTDLSPQYDPTVSMCQNMITWLNARQDGVDAARAEVPDTDVKVYHAPELNLGDLATQGRPTVTNSVLPGTHCDLYSYSSWDAISGASSTHFRSVLDYIATKAPDRAPFGSKNIYIGEFGWPEIDAGTAGAMNIIKTATATALSWGCRYVIYWQVYDNECSANPVSNSDCRGFWMFRRDGSTAPSHDYFVSLINPTPLGVNVARYGATAMADSMNSASEAPGKAIDGVIASNAKWTSAGTAPPHWLMLDLGRMRQVHTFVVRHAGSGGETTAYNTRRFSIQSSPSSSGPWTDEFVVDNSTDQYNLTLRNYFDVKSLRYVRLHITTAGSDNYARIPEFEIWGDPGTAAFFASPTTGNMPLTVQFTDASAGNIDAWSWTFGDGGTSTQQNPAHTYTRAGLFTATLTVTSPSGPQSQAVSTVRVHGADFDGDGDVDQNDFALLQRCLTGEANPQNDPGCLAAQIDNDNDVDAADVALFLSCMNGSDSPPASGCPFAH